MSSDVVSCYIFTEDKSLSNVFLPDNKEVLVGRNPETKIEDSQCSRDQVRLLANYAERTVSIEQVGQRPSGLNGFKTDKGIKMTAQHGDRLEIIYGKYPYKIEFNPSPTINSTPKKIKKRLISQDSEDEDEAHSLKKSKIISDLAEQFDIDKSINKDKNADSVEKNLGKTVSSSNSISKMTDSSENGTWEHFEKTLYVYTSIGCEGRSKIAAYDMDKTLIKTKSGLEFPKDAHDWQLLYSEVPGKLKKYYEDGYKIVIFSNQNSLGNGKIPVKDFKLKIERVVKKMGIPMQVFLAVGQSIYRKPRTGMWDFLVNKKNDGVAVEKENSFFIGDAAGRPADKSRKKKDHSLADRLLALNLGLTFHTPEEHFLGQKVASYKAPTFNPKEASKNTVLYDPPQAKITSDKQEVVIMVGCQGSGKSHFAKKHLKSYTYVNRDTLGSWQKCVAKTDEALAQGKSVVVDNTNPDKISRQRYINVAKKHKVPVRCFFMALEKDHIKHNNMFRTLTDPSHQTISDMLINTYLKNFTPPSENEGFSEIVKINFVPCFQSEEDRKLYEMYLLG